MDTENYSLPIILRTQVFKKIFFKLLTVDYNDLKLRKGSIIYMGHEARPSKYSAHKKQLNYGK